MEVVHAPRSWVFGKARWWFVIFQVTHRCLMYFSAHGLGLCEVMQGESSGRQGWEKKGHLIGVYGRFWFSVLVKVIGQRLIARENPSIPVTPINIPVCRTIEVHGMMISYASWAAVVSRRLIREMQGHGQLKSVSSSPCRRRIAAEQLRNENRDLTLSNREDISEMRGNETHNHR